MTRKFFGALIAGLLISFNVSALEPDEALYEEVEHHYVNNNGVNIHYVTKGEGNDVVLFVHGFPNWWYDWRNQMVALADAGYKVAALDNRGYNRSDKPAEKEAYHIDTLISDVGAVINDLGVQKVTLVGHDWGAGISWRYSAFHPERVKNLIIVNITHPATYMAVYNSATPEQEANTAYIRRIYESTEPGPGMIPELMAQSKGGSEYELARHREAYEKTSMNNILDYYRMVYPLFESGEFAEVPNHDMPVLQFHGMLDRAVDSDGLRDTWDYMNEDFTLITIPGVGHDPHHEAADFVNAHMISWLKLH